MKEKRKMIIWHFNNGQVGVEYINYLGISLNDIKYFLNESEAYKYALKFKLPIEDRVGS